jgi:hypothetical protein
MYVFNYNYAVPIVWYCYLDDRISASCDIISVLVNMGFHRGVVCVHVDSSVDLHCFIVYEELVPLIFVLRVVSTKCTFLIIIMLFR